jgi:NodT family efflux transporter outer membrane factor (OMF) lipoprotein
VAITRQKHVSGAIGSSISGSTTGGINTNVTSTTGGASTSTNSSGPFTSHSLLLNALWEPDIWGSVARTVEASEAGAEASAAQIALTRLSAEASLAQFYFELRAVDKDQQLLSDTVRDYKHALQLTQNRYTAGVAARADVVQAQAQLESATALAINNHINRALYEHAIAVLIGQPPSAFAIKFKPLTALPPEIPITIPAVMLERRPDVAQAERLMAQANAQIGIAIAAYFPTLSLSASGSVQNLGYAHWFSLPALNWSVGPQLAETLFDGGLRQATTAAARHNYEATVGSYRQIVLAAFQDVEDNMASLRILHTQAIAQYKAAASAREAVKLIINQYKAGTLAYSDVITAQTTAYNAEKSAADVRGLQMTAAVGLIKSLGGGWN